METPKIVKSKMTLKYIRFCIMLLIIPQIGFEPIQRDPKSLVLPLHYRGVNFSAIIIHNN